jgi:hypothetical protein
MSSGDFTYITLRNITAYQPNNRFVPNGYILTTSTNGKANWKSIDDIVFTSISTNLATNGTTINAITSSILSNTTVSTLTSKILTNENISTIVGIILSKSSPMGDDITLKSVTLH